MQKYDLACACADNLYTDPILFQIIKPKTDTNI